MTIDSMMRRCALLLAGCLAFPVQAADDHLMADKTSVQAAFLYNFAVFTDWPDLPEREFSFCVLGDEGMLEALASVKNKQMKDKSILVRKIESSRQWHGCQVLFIGTAEHRAIKDIREQSAKVPVLLVADEGAYDVQDVLIVLSEQQGRISFRINRSEATSRSMTFSSKLLKLATQVY
jgi:hypothetical protein